MVDRKRQLLDEATLRQYYAGLAMQGLIANPCYKGHVTMMEPLVKTAVEMADALIAELNKNHQALALETQDIRQAVECPNSPNGRHQIDTSMESGPHNCFYCESRM